MVDGRFAVAEHEGGFWLRSLDQIDQLKRAAATYAGLEKRGVHEVIRSNRNIVDVEIALAGDNTKGELPPDEEEVSSPDQADEPPASSRRKSALRIDFAALVDTSAGLQLRFFEAKHFSNSELRAANQTAPVVGQIARYEGLLRAYEADGNAVSKAYRKVCQHLASSRPGAVDPIVQAVAEGRSDFTVDTQPWLVVFGYDADQIAKGSRGAAVFESLRAALSGRIVTRGNPKGFTNKISTNT
jgi:hypothetical protein